MSILYGHIPRVLITLAVINTLRKGYYEALLSCKPEGPLGTFLIVPGRQKQLYTLGSQRAAPPAPPPSYDLYFFAKNCKHIGLVCLIPLSPSNCIIKKTKVLNLYSEYCMQT